MISKIKCLMVLQIAIFGVSTVLAQDSGPQRDTEAIDVLKSMSAYTASLDNLVLKATAFTDARLGAGLMVSNSAEIELIIDRPGSMRVTSFDGAQSKVIYFHDGLLTVFGSGKKFYGQANIPKEIEAAMDFSLNELGVEAPLMDMVYKDVSTHLIGSQDSILYLTDKSRVGGTDCHQIAIRGTEVDIQLWVEEGDRPVPRKIMITSKWEGGAPRFFANMIWDSAPEIDPGVFVFKAPEGSVNIGLETGNSTP